MNQNEKKNYEDDYEDDYDVDPSDLIGKNFKVEREPKASIEKLAFRMEKELNGQGTGQPFDFRDQVKKQEKEIEKLEEKVDDLQEKLLPHQNIDPDNELESGEDISLPGPNLKDKYNQKLEAYKKRLAEEQKIEEERVKKTLELEEQRKREELEWQRKQEEAEIQRQEELRKKREAQQEKIRLHQEARERRRSAKIKKAEEARQRKIARQNEREHRKLIKQQEKLELKNLSPKTNFAWYLKEIKRPLVYLVGLELLIYFLSLIPALKILMLDVFLPLLIFIDILVLSWLALQINKKYSSRSLTIQTCLMAGVSIAFLRAVFKLAWINELWTVLNLLVEPLLYLCISLVISFIISLFLKSNKKVKLNASESI